MKSVEDRLDQLEARCALIEKHFSIMEQLGRSTQDMVNMQVFVQERIEELMRMLKGEPRIKGN